MSRRLSHLLVSLAALSCLRCPATTDPVATPPPDDGIVDPTERIDPEDIEALGIRPSEALVGVGESFALKAIATTYAGEVYDLALAEWHTSDPAVAIIDIEGRVTAVAPGEVELWASVGEVEGVRCQLRVTDDAQLRIEVVDADTGLPVEGAQLLIGGARPHARAETDASGQGLLDLSEGVGALTIAAEGYRRTTVAGFALREMRVPIRRRSLPQREVTLRGAVELPEAGPGDLNAALVVTSVEAVQGFTGTELIAPTRSEEELSEFGVPWPIPRNVQVGELVPDFVAVGPPGRRAAVSISGQFELTDLLDLMTALSTGEGGAGAVVSMLARRRETLRMSVSEAHELGAGEEADDLWLGEGELLTHQTQIRFSLPPRGWYWPDPVVVLPLRPMLGAGSVVAGMGVGEHPFQSTPPDIPDGDDDDSTPGIQAGRAPALPGPLAMLGLGPDPLAIEDAGQRVTAPVWEVERAGVWDEPTQYMAWLQVGGALDAPAQRHHFVQVLSPPTREERVELPPFLEPTEVFRPPYFMDHLEWNADPDADLVHITIERMYGSEGSPLFCDEYEEGLDWEPGEVLWDLWLHPRLNGLVLPQELADLAPLEEDNPYPPMIRWRIDAVGIDGASFESLLAPSDEPLEQWQETVRRRCYFGRRECSIVP